ncbi:MAG: tetratricopeptide repeat protein [Candidatus Omnitrophica bacterium]|nr:tetratricopeptide repeat protein [Candidatus Omnitrophota bacterium]
MKNKGLSNYILVLVLILVSIGVYVNTLKGDFLIDDEQGILNNERIHDIGTYFSNHFKIKPGALLEISRVFLWNISKNNPFCYHLFNVLVHTGCVILLFILCGILFNNKTLSFLSSFIFAVHPIHTEAVSWISGGHYAFSGLFYIAAFIFYVKSFNSIRNLCLCVLFFVLCLFSGNACATLPFMFILYDLFFRGEGKERVACRRIRIAFLSSIFILAIIFLAAFFISKNDFMHKIFYFRGFNYLIVAAKAFVYYLKILYLPVQRGLYHPFAFNTTHIQDVSPALFYSLVILLIAGWSFFKFRRSFKPLSFGVMWFFLTYAPYSNIVPMCNIISERYLYLPSLGFCVIMAALFLKAWEIINRSVNYRKALRLLAVAALTLFLGSYMLLTIAHNYEYDNIITYWETNIRNFPDGYTVYNNLAATYYRMGNINNAIAYCLINLMVDSGQPHVWCNLGKIYREIGDFDQARYCYQEVLKIDEDYFPAVKALQELNIKEKDENEQ